MTNQNKREYDKLAKTYPFNTFGYDSSTQRELIEAVIAYKDQARNTILKLAIDEASKERTCFFKHQDVLFMEEILNIRKQMRNEIVTALKSLKIHETEITK